MTWFRNACYSFFTLLLLPFPLAVGDLLSGLRSYYHWMCDPLVELAGRYLFHIDFVIRYADNGSGDGLYNWVYHATLVVLATVLGGLITLIWRDRPRRSAWPRWLLFFVAISLAYYLLSYGFAKVFAIQFVDPSLNSFYETYGRSSPMHLLWTFMGYSRPYVVFTGLLEVLAGILLLFPRTRTAGALFALGIMVHVFMLNVSYDVPVKLFSIQLILQSLALMWSDRIRLWRFVTNKSIAPHPSRGPLRSKRGTNLLTGFTCVLMTCLCLLTIRASRVTMRDFSRRSPLYGIYEVTEMRENDTLIPPLLTDHRYWKRIVFEHPRYALVTFLNDTVQQFTCAIDPRTQNLKLHDIATGELYLALHYKKTDAGMELFGQTKNVTLAIDTKAVDLSEFGIRRGLHWVNEVPYNRYQH